MRLISHHAVPGVRLIRTQDNDRVDRIDMVRRQYQPGDRVATEAVGGHFVINARLFVRLAVPVHRRTLRDTAVLDIDVRIKNGHGQMNDRVTVLIRDRVRVRAALVIRLAVVLQCRTCTDRLVNIRMRYLFDRQIQTINGLRTAARLVRRVVRTRTVHVQTVPCVRLTLTDHCRLFDRIHRIRGHDQAYNRITVIDVLLRFVIDAGLTDHLTFPFDTLALRDLTNDQGRIHIQNVQRQVNDTVTTHVRLQRVMVSALLRQVLRTPVVVTAATDTVRDIRLGNVLRAQLQTIDDTVPQTVLRTHKVVVSAWL